MILLQVSDFTGFFNLALTASAENVLQSYIDEYEAKFIRDLLGINLGNAYIEDKSNPSQDPIFTAIEDPFQIEDNDVDYESKGLAYLLKALIFYEFVTDSQNQHTQSGVVRRDVETALALSGRTASRFAEKKRNGAKDTWDTIQWYVDEYAEEDYTDTPFNGKPMDLEWGSIM